MQNTVTIVQISTSMKRIVYKSFDLPSYVRGLVTRPGHAIPTSKVFVTVPQSHFLTDKFKT